jgi:putative nucleotidyltransferase with HDIG domain
LPETMDVRRRTIPLWAKALILALAYIFAAEVGNLLSVQRTFSTFWPPAGLYLAMLLISDRRDWPVLILAAFAGNLTSDLLHGRALLMTLGFSTANSLEVITGATLVGRLIGHRPKLDSLREVLVLTGFGAFLATIVGATLGTGVVLFYFPGATWSTTWLSWWIGDALGVVLVGSVILSAIGWWDSFRDDVEARTGRWWTSLLWATALSVLFAIVAFWVFRPMGGATSWKFSTTPGYVAVGMLGGPFGAALGALVIATGTIAGMLGSAPLPALASADTAVRVFQAQGFVAVGAIMALALAGVIAENRRNAANAVAAATQFRELFDTMREGVAYCRMVYDDRGSPVDWVFLQVNRAFGELTGLRDVVGRHVWEVLPGLGETDPELFATYGAVASTGTPALLESAVVPLDRTLRISVTSPAQGEFVAVFEDVSDRVSQERALAASNKRLEKMVYDVVETMGSVVEARDPYTQGHEVRVSSLARRIAKEMGLPDGDLDEIGMAGLLHDIGKLRVPSEILTKPGVLSTAEFALIKEHPAQGHEILGHIDFGWPVADIVLQHHERMDGSGYPAGLMGADIMVAARVLAVADVVEAMASHRPYRPAVGLEQAVSEIATHPDKYDTEAVAACIRLYDRGETGL